MTDKINLTEEQERMWKKLSEPYVPPFNGYGGPYGGYSPIIGYRSRSNGDSNIAIGYSASSTGTSNIAIGSNAGYYSD